MKNLNYLLSEAKQRHGDKISFCGGRTSWEQCVTTDGDVTMLWYNTPDNSSHTVSCTDLPLKSVLLQLVGITESFRAGLISDYTALIMRENLLKIW